MNSIRMALEFDGEPRLATIVLSADEELLSAILNRNLKSVRFSGEHQKVVEHFDRQYNMK